MDRLFLPVASTRPSPLFRPFGQLGPHWVAFDIAQHGEQVLVLLNGKSLESSLPDVSASMIMLVIATHVRIENPVHPAAQVPIVNGPDNEMKVIGQEAECQDAHGDFDAGVSNRLQERLIIAVLEKDLPPRVATIDDVVTDTADRSARRPRHGGEYSQLQGRMSIKNMNVPFSFPVRRWPGPGSRHQSRAGCAESDHCAG